MSCEEYAVGMEGVSSCGCGREDNGQRQGWGGDTIVILVLPRRRWLLLNDSPRSAAVVERVNQRSVIKGYSVQRQVP